MSRKVLSRSIAAAITTVPLLLGTVSLTAAQQITEPLVIASHRAINTLDPTAMNQAWQLRWGVGETLMTMTPEGEPVPWLLESLVNIAPTQWELVLREGISFQNGTTLNAERLAAFLEYQSANSTLAGALLPDLQAEVTGDYTVVITTPEPDSVVPRKLVQYNAFVVYDLDAVRAANGDEDAFAASGYMTGPFVVESYSDTELVLTRNENYWQGTPPLPGVRVLNIPDAQARLTAVRAGEAHWARQMSVDYGPLLENDPQAFFLQADWESSIRIEMNQAVPPLDEIPVRRALSLAIDYREIAEDFMAGYMSTATGLYPAEFAGSLANQITDQSAAAALLDEAGWVDSDGDGIRDRDGEDLRIVLLATGGRSDHVTMALAVEQQLAPIGIDIEVQQVERVGDIALETDDWNAAVVSNGTLSQWSGSYETQLTRYHLSDSVQNYGRTADPELDQLAADLISEFDPDRKLELFQQLQRLMVEERAYLIAVTMQRPSLVVDETYQDYQLSNWFRHFRWDTVPTNP